MRTIYYTTHIRKAYPNELYHGYSTELYHHGIKGQKWGVRRYQNPDGTLTAAGKIHYGLSSRFSLNKVDREWSKKRLKSDRKMAERKKLLNLSTKDEKEYSKMVENDGFKERYVSTAGGRKSVTYDRPANGKKYKNIRVEIEFDEAKKNRPMKDLDKANRYSKNVDKIVDSAVEHILSDDGGYYTPERFGFSSKEAMRKSLKPTIIDATRDSILFDIGDDYTFGWFTVDLNPENHTPIGLEYND